VEDFFDCFDEVLGGSYQFGGGGGKLPQHPPPWINPWQWNLSKGTLPKLRGQPAIEKTLLAAARSNLDALRARLSNPTKAAHPPVASIPPAGQALIMKLASNDGATV
jgi:hypothetical protein